MLRTYPEIVIETLYLRGPVAQVAAARIEELEQQVAAALGAAEGCNELNAELLDQREKLERRLTAERETARKYATVAEREMDVMWGADEPHESGSGCISCERLATQETWPYCRICLLTAQLDVCDEGFKEARLCIERLERQLQETEATRDEWVEIGRRGRDLVRKLQEAAQAQSEEIQCGWLSPAEAEEERDNNMTKTLKPCPFCGGEAEYGRYNISGEQYIGCLECAVVVLHDVDLDEQDVIAHWNIRKQEEETT